MGEPVAAAPTATAELTSPTPSPEPTPTESPSPAKPYSSQSEGESQFYVDLAFDFDEDSVWGEVFDAVAEPERLCIENELGDELLATAREHYLLSEDQTPTWQVAAFSCLAPETAATVFFSRMVADIKDLLNEEAEACLRDLLVQADIVGMVAASLPDAAGSNAEEVTAQFTGKLFKCIAQIPMVEDAEPPADSHSPIWRYQTGGWVVNAPAVVSGMVFAGSDDNHIYALDAESGELVWSYETGDVIRSTPTESDGVVFAGSNDGYVHALRTETGEVLWDVRHRHACAVHARPAGRFGLPRRIVGRPLQRACARCNVRRACVDRRRAISVRCPVCRHCCRRDDLRAWRFRRTLRHGRVHGRAGLDLHWGHGCRLAAVGRRWLGLLDGSQLRVWTGRRYG